MKRGILFFITLMNLVLFTSSCAESTFHEASQDLQKGISGQGQLEERSWDDVEVFQE